MKYLVSLAVALVVSFNANALSVVVHPSNAVELSKTEIMHIFLGKQKQFADGKQATPLSLPGSEAVTASFSKQVLNKTTSQLKSYWAKQIFTGKGKPPAEIASEQALLDKIAADPSAIGFVATPSDKVRVVATF